MTNKTSNVYSVLTFEEKANGDVAITVDSTWNLPENAEVRRGFLEDNRKCKAQIYHSMFHSGELCKDCNSPNFHLPVDKKYKVNIDSEGSPFYQIKEKPNENKRKMKEKTKPIESKKRRKMKEETKPIEPKKKNEIMGQIKEALKKKN